MTQRNDPGVPLERSSGTPRLEQDPPERGQHETEAPRRSERQLWRPGDPGVLVLPSGRLVRGRGLRNPMPSGHPPTFGAYLLGRPPPEFGWDSRWVRWPDFWLPADPAYLRTVLIEVLARAGAGRAELACGGGRGRTGTALACLLILDGLPTGEAVAHVRAHYDRHAVETPWQHRFVRRFSRSAS